MCRLFAMRASRPMRVDHSLVDAQNALVRQSRGDRRGEIHTDGWGIAHYHEREPVVEKRTVAAHQTVHFSTAAARVESTAVVAHVRRATIAGPAIENTHPFHWRQWTFAHNGTLRGFDQLESELAAEAGAFARQRRGATDSELLFCWLLAERQRDGHDLDQPVSAEPMAAWLGRKLRALSARSAAVTPTPSELNIVLTDGDCMWAARFGHSLYWHPANGSVLVASEPVCGAVWCEVADSSVLAIDPRCRVAIVPAR